MNLLDEEKLRNDWCKKQINQCNNTDHNKCIECTKYDDCDIEYTLRKGHPEIGLVIVIFVIFVLIILYEVIK